MYEVKCSSREIVPNHKGKDSDVKVTFSLKEGQANSHDWSGCIQLNRNAHPFRKEGVSVKSAIELIDDLTDQLRKEITKTYQETNVDYVPIVAFLEKSKEQFLGGLPVGKLKKRKR